MKYLVVLFAVGLTLSFAVLGHAGTIGEPVVTDSGGFDGWNSNMIVLKSQNYQNGSGVSETITPTDWTFAGRDQSAVTPFIVQLNDTNGNGDFLDDDDYTVMAIGSTRVSNSQAGGAGDYGEGITTLPFGGAAFDLMPDAVIAAAYLDADADGENGPTSVIKWDNNVLPAGSQWYDGQSAVPHGEPTPLSVGQNWQEETDASVSVRQYHFNIDFTAAPVPEPSSLLLMACAMVTFGLFGSRRRK